MTPLDRAAVIRQAESLGFLAAGVADLGPSRRGDALDAWLAKGYGGTMRYLHRQAKKRKAPAAIVAGAKSAVVVLENYFAAGPTPVGRVKIARYARGGDYHRVMTERLERLADWLRAEGATIARPFVDSGPVPERELAERAGLGWIGKNAMLIRPGVGSFFFIGSVLTDLPLPSTPSYDTDRCGTCTRCLDACPTGAFVAPRVLDATRCIAYLTIEQKGPMPDTVVPELDGWAFGCDICNEVCPWNVRFAEPTADPSYRSREPVPSDDPEYFERMTEADFEHRFGATPLERAGLAGMRRNLASAHASLAGPDLHHPSSRER